MFKAKDLDFKKKMFFLFTHLVNIIKSIYDNINNVYKMSSQSRCGGCIGLNLYEANKLNIILKTKQLYVPNKTKYSLQIILYYNSIR